MITNAILTVLVSFLAFIIRAFPQISLPSSALGAFQSVGYYIAPITLWIPFDVFLSCVAAYFVSWLICAIISAILQLL
ncbi:MAG: hypothetical protein RR233_08230 [Clostridiales bacterium]